MIKLPHWNPIINVQEEMDVESLNFLHRGVHCIFAINHTTNQCRGCEYHNISLCPKKSQQGLSTAENIIKFGPRVCYNYNTRTVYHIRILHNIKMK